MSREFKPVNLYPRIVNNDYSRAIGYALCIEPRKKAIPYLLIAKIIACFLIGFLVFKGTVCITEKCNERIEKAQERRAAQAAHIVSC
jgi:hypothetical protein